MNYYECDNCTTRQEAVRRGIYQLVPEGWFVIADGPVNKREIEIHVCGIACRDARLQKVRQLGSIPEKDLVVKAILRGV